MQQLIIMGPLIRIRILQGHGRWTFASSLMQVLTLIMLFILALHFGSWGASQIRCAQYVAAGDEGNMLMSISRGSRLHEYSTSSTDEYIIVDDQMKQEYQVSAYNVTSHERPRQNSVPMLIREVNADHLNTLPGSQYKSNEAAINYYTGQGMNGVIGTYTLHLEHTVVRLPTDIAANGRSAGPGAGTWWSPPMSIRRRRRMEEEEVSSSFQQNVSRGRGLMERMYQRLFEMTHARLHPVHQRPVRVMVVDQSGRGDSRTVQGAIDMVRLDNKWRIHILIHAGIYREKVYVPYQKPFITFQGSGSGNTIITWNARASDRNQGGEILGTFGSASVAIDSDYFVARDITFQNTSPPPLPGAEGMQAVALRISGDKAAFIDCRMLGAQDTLFDHVGRHFFLRCYIEGAIDFIFGDGRSLYLNCELHANAVTYGAVAASQRNSANDNTGFSFVQCKITGTGLLYLGRAWGQYARILFAFCYFENIIIPDGWYDWGDTSRRETVFFGEYKCWGPGAQPRWRASWSRQLSFQEARPFLSLGFINGHKWFNILT